MKREINKQVNVANDLVHLSHDKPNVGSLVVIQTMSGTIVIGEFHDSETIGGYVRLSRRSVCPWGLVLRWFYPRAVFGEEGL